MRMMREIKRDREKAEAAELQRLEDERLRIAAEKKAAYEKKKADAEAKM